MRSPDQVPLGRPRKWHCELSNLKVPKDHAETLKAIALALHKNPQLTEPLLKIIA